MRGYLESRLKCSSMEPPHRTVDWERSDRTFRNRDNFRAKAPVDARARRLRQDARKLRPDGRDVAAPFPE